MLAARRFGAASTRRKPSLKRSIVPTGSSAGTSTTGGFVDEPFLIPHLTSDEPDDRYKCCGD
jgi:hypothetical protein